MSVFMMDAGVPRQQLAANNGQLGRVITWSWSCEHLKADKFWWPTSKN